MKAEILEHIGGCTNVDCACAEKNQPFISCSDPVAFLYDTDADSKKQPCQLVSKSDEYQITILNKPKKPFVLVKFDACIITDSESRCDALVYNDCQFYFVEIKDTKLNQKSSVRKKAIKQLKASVERLSEVDFNDREKFAIIAFSSPKSRIINTASNKQRALFMDNFGIKLMEGHALTMEYWK